MSGCCLHSGISHVPGSAGSLVSPSPASQRHCRPSTQLMFISEDNDETIKNGWILEPSAPLRCVAVLAAARVHLAIVTQEIPAQMYKTKYAAIGLASDLGFAPLGLIASFFLSPLRNALAITVGNSSADRTFICSHHEHPLHVVSSSCQGHACVHKHDHDEVLKLHIFTPHTQSNAQSPSHARTHERRSSYAHAY